MELDAERNMELMERTAFNGEFLQFDLMPAAEYKYYRRIADLGRDMRSGKYTTAQVASLRNEYFAEYTATKEHYSWPEIIKLTEDLRVHINGSDDPAFIAAVALRALYLITNDSTLERKMKQMEEVFDNGTQAKA